MSHLSTEAIPKQAIVNIRKAYPEDEIIFANGGDRTKDNIPEMDIVDPNLSFVFGVGGNKKNSSSDILKNWHRNSDGQY